jgi:hypothetical protein
MRAGRLLVATALAALACAPTGSYRKTLTFTLSTTSP